MEILTDNEISAVYEELATLQIELDDDPLLYGPKRLNGKIAKTRAMLTRCEQIFLELSRRLHGCQREHRKQTALLEMQKQDLLANDPEVRAGRNIADRDAIAAIKLRSQIEKVQGLETATTDLETVLAVVKVKRADIKDIQNRLKDQIKVCQDEIGLGARWGSSKPPSESTPALATGQLGATPPKFGSDDDVYIKIDAELAAIEAAAEKQPAPAAVIAPPEVLFPAGQVLASTATQSDADEALDGLDLDDPEDLLSGLILE